MTLVFSFLLFLASLDGILILAQEFLSKSLYPRTKIIIDADLEDNIIVNVDYSRVDPKLREDKKNSDNE